VHPVGSHCTDKFNTVSTTARTLFPIM